MYQHFFRGVFLHCVLIGNPAEILVHMHMLQFCNNMSQSLILVSIALFY